jgi:hypothetical protein
MIILPTLSVIINLWVLGCGCTLIPLIGKWFIFWAIGVRLFSAGIKQAISPAFTLENIFKIQNTESQVIVRELGFANTCMGTLGILALFFIQFRLAAAATGGLFLGLAGIMHAIRKPATQNEVLAMVSNLFVFVIILIYLIFNL